MNSKIIRRFFDGANIEKLVHFAHDEIKCNMVSINIYLNMYIIEG